MEDKEIERVPKQVLEYVNASHERTEKRLVTVIILLILLLFATNFYWVREWTSYDYSDVTVDGQDGGNANYMGAGASGVINNGESGSQNEEEKE